MVWVYLWYWNELRKCTILHHIHVDVPKFSVELDEKIEFVISRFYLQIIKNVKKTTNYSVFTFQRLDHLIPNDSSTNFIVGLTNLRNKDQEDVQLKNFYLTNWHLKHFWSKNILHWHTVKADFLSILQCKSDLGTKIACLKRKCGKSFVCVADFIWS